MSQSLIGGILTGTVNSFTGLAPNTIEYLVVGGGGLAPDAHTVTHA